MEIISTVVSTLSNWLFGTVLIWLLLGAGAFLTWRTRAVQLRRRAAIGFKHEKALSLVNQFSGINKAGAADAAASALRLRLLLR